MMPRLRHVVRNLLRRRAADADLTAELESFVAERPRAARLGSGLEGWARDLRLAARALRHAPKLTAACVLTFALGIGANVAIFSMANALLFRPLPVAQPGQLQFVSVQQPPSAVPLPVTLGSHDIRLLLQQGAAVSSGAAGAAIRPVGLSVDGQARTALAMYVTPGFFPLLGIHPARGRFFNQTRAPGIVLSYAYWQSRFAGRTDIIGHTAVLRGKPVTILGVAPKGFHGVVNVLDTQAFIPLGLAPSQNLNMMTLVRIKPGASVAAGDAVLAAFAQTLAREHPAQDAHVVLRFLPLNVGTIGAHDGSNPLVAIAGLFLALSALVLLLAAANVMGLLLARGSARGHEMAVRAALGASRTRLLRQVFLETVLLAVGGAIFGVALGAIASHALSALPPNVGFPLVLNFGLDWRVLAYAVAMAVLVALAAGMAPAWRASAADPCHALRAEGAGTTRRQRLRSLLVGAQVAAALVLLIVAGLFVRNLRHAEPASLGFVADGVWNYSFDAASAGFNSAQGKAFFQKLLPHARAPPRSVLPGRADARRPSAARRGCVRGWRGPAQG